MKHSMVKTQLAAFIAAMKAAGMEKHPGNLAALEWLEAIVNSPDIAPANASPASYPVNAQIAVQRLQVAEMQQELAALDARRKAREEAATPGGRRRIAAEQSAKLADLAMARAKADGISYERALAVVSRENPAIVDSYQTAYATI